MKAENEFPKAIPEFNGFKAGDCVKVKSGIKDPDNEKLIIGDWCGRIKEIYEDGIELIKWDSITIRAMLRIALCFANPPIHNSFAYAQITLYCSAAFTIIGNHPDGLPLEFRIEFTTSFFHGRLLG